jgi:hypothetical protein
MKTKKLLIVLGCVSFIFIAEIRSQRVPFGRRRCARVYG